MTTLKKPHLYTDRIKKWESVHRQQHYCERKGFRGAYIHSKKDIKKSQPVQWLSFLMFMWVLGSFLFLHDPALWGKNKLPPKNLIANKLLNLFLNSYCWKRKFRFKAEACNPLFTECSCCYAIIIEYIMEQCGIMFLLTGMWRRCIAMPELLVISMLFICEGRSTFCSSSPQNKKGFYSNIPKNLLFSLSLICWKKRENYSSNV